MTTISTPEDPVADSELDATKTIRQVGTEARAGTWAGAHLAAGSSPGSTMGGLVPAATVVTLA
jgi:hypothetical protein